MTLPRTTAWAETSFTGPGSAFVTFEAQANGENSTTDAANCELRIDGQVAEYRYIAVPGDRQVAVTASTLATGSAGQHTASMVCRKGNQNAIVSFPEGRARLSVLTG